MASYMGRSEEGGVHYWNPLGLGSGVIAFYIFSLYSNFLLGDKKGRLCWKLAHNGNFEVHNFHATKRISDSLLRAYGV